MHNSLKQSDSSSLLSLSDLPFKHWFWTESPAMLRLKNQLRSAAQRKLSVLLVGESGSGKEIVCQTLYQVRRREFGLSEVEAPFVAVNCGALPEALLESILFGHERGAFTSARERQLGKFELARRGVLYLDEIQTMSAECQVKLLRVLQTRQVERLGGRGSQSVECQIVASTNVPLERLVENKTFRKDLYYRLNICPLYLPALRQRKEEIHFIAEALMKKIKAEYQIEVKLSAEARKCFEEYEWPGNIRELEHALVYGAINASGPQVERHDLPDALTGRLQSYIHSGDWHI